MENGFFGRPQKAYLYSRGLTILGGIITGSRPFVDISGTWNTSVGSPIPTAFRLNVTNINSPFSYLMDLQVGGVSTISFSKTGSITAAGVSATNISAGSSGFIFWTSQTLLSSPSDGLLKITNSAATDFTRLQLGGSTSSFPAIGRNGIFLEVLAADGAATASLAVYNTKTSTTNFERLDVQWATNVCQVWTEKGSGGGTARDLVLGADATELERFQTGSKIGWFGATPVVRQTSGANLTNNVTAGGTTDQIDDFSSLTVYATDAAAIRNDIYQLARKLKQINDGLRALGLFT